MDLRVGGNSVFSISKSGVLNIGRNSAIIYPTTTIGTLSAVGRNITFQSSETSGNNYMFHFRNINNSVQTSGVAGGINTSLNFTPTSGTGEFNLVNLPITINQTGGANGTTRGLFINPTITAAADWRAIETTVGNVILGSTSGNVGIGTTNPSAKLHVYGGNIKIEEGSGGDEQIEVSGGYLAKYNGLNNAWGFAQDRIYINGDTGNVGIGTTTPNAKLDVNGNTVITGSLTVTQGITGSLFGTASFAQTASFAPAYLPITLPQTTGLEISFTQDRVYGTFALPETGSAITSNTASAILGVTNLIIHSASAAPTTGSDFKKLSGSPNYVPGLNYIYCTYIADNQIIYSINQAT